MKNLIFRFRKRKKVKPYKVDTSQKGFEYVGIKLSDEQFQDMGTCGTGTHIILQGRIQSREYNKKVGNQVEKKTAYEVSAYWVEDKEE